MQKIICRLASYNTG